MDNIKIASRCTHMLSTMIISGITINNYLSDSHLDRKLSSQQSFSLFYNSSIFFLFTSGILNIFLNKNGKKLENPIWKIWIHFFELKFILALLLTPIIYTVTLPFASDQQISETTKNKIQFYIVMFMFIYSPFIKYYREEVCFNFQDDLVLHKIQKLQERYQLSKNKKDGPLEDEDETEQKENDLLMKDIQEDEQMLKKSKQQSKQNKVDPQKEEQMKNIQEQLKKMKFLEDQMQRIQNQQHLFQVPQNQDRQNNNPKDVNKQISKNIEKKESQIKSKSKEQESEEIQRQILELRKKEQELYDKLNKVQKNQDPQEIYGEEIDNLYDQEMDDNSDIDGVIIGSQDEDEIPSLEEKDVSHKSNNQSKSANRDDQLNEFLKLQNLLSEQKLLQQIKK